VAIGDPRDILVIDDSDIARARMVRVLTEAGFRVLDLPSPIGATRGVVRHGVRLVVVDVHMPAMSGDKLAALFRDNPRLSEVKVVLVSGVELDQLGPIAADVEADAVVSKHDGEQALLRAVRRLLGEPA